MVSAQPGPFAPLFDMLPEQVYYSRPIALRHPIVFYEGHLPGLQLQHAGEERRSAARASTRASRRCSRAASIRTSRRPARTSARRWPDRDAVRAFADEADARVIDALVARGARSARAIRCSIARKPCSASSSTRRCTRRRCSTCGIACAFDEKHRPDGYAPMVEGRTPADEWIDIPRGPRGARRRSRRRAVWMGQRVPGVHEPTCRRFRSSATT